MTTRHDDHGRWTMLALLCAGFVAATLNWFNVSAAFGEISAEFGVGLGPLSALISLFIVTYAAFHIPGGVLATRFGMVNVLVAGLVVESLGGILSGLSLNFAMLAAARLLAGLGASVFVAVGFAAAMVWFQRSGTTLALGISSGAAFGVGASAGLYVWVYVQEAVGWRAALVIAGVLGLVTAVVTALFFRTPRHLPALRGTAVDRAGLVATLRNRQMWIYSCAMLGGYGAYFTAAQLLASYGVAERGFTEAQGGLLGAAITLAGIPASILGGYVADRTHNIKLVVVASLVVSGLAVAVLPATPPAALWPIGFGVGFFVIFGFTAWSAVPTRVSMVSPEHIGTATGLMLSIAGVGGILVPIGFGQVAQSAGFATGWALLGALTVVLALVGVAARNAIGAPGTAPGAAAVPSPEPVPEG